MKVYYECGVVFFIALLLFGVCFIIYHLKNRMQSRNHINKDLRGSKISHFTTHGCMGNQHDFNYLGIIVDKIFADEGPFWKIKVLKNRSGELRDKKDKKIEYQSIPTWYVQDIGHGTYVAYD